MTKIKLFFKMKATNKATFKSTFLEQKKEKVFYYSYIWT